MKWIFTIAAVFLLWGCSGLNSGAGQDAPSPPGYRLGDPQKILLNQSMDEISGFLFYPPMNAFIALNDEQGKLYAIPLDGTRKYDSWRFAKQGDFEDLVFTGKNWYALKSNGNIFAIRNPFTDSSSAENFSFPAGGRNELESLYFDDLSNQLIAICKSCSSDDKNEVSAFAFNPVTSQYSSSPVYRINVKEVETKLNQKKINLKPSAAAIHPVTKELYIIASVNRLLLVAERNGKLKDVYPLKVSLFKQPEGITFAPNGDMYVSNEAQDGIANILKFPYQPGK
jgi:hypothetical protein